MHLFVRIFQAIFFCNTSDSFCILNGVRTEHWELLSREFMLPIEQESVYIFLVSLLISFPRSFLGCRPAFVGKIKLYKYYADKKTPLIISFISNEEVKAKLCKILHFCLSYITTV